VAKLGGLVIKSLAKPLSKRIKHDISQYKLGRSVLIQLGRTIHQITSRFTIWSSGFKVRSIKPLDRDKALNNGAEVLGEGFLLTVSGSLVVYEYQKSAHKNTLQKERIQQEKEAHFRAIYQLVAELQQRLDTIEAKRAQEKNRQQQQQRSRDEEIKKEQENDRKQEQQRQIEHKKTSIIIEMVQYTKNLLKTSHYFFWHDFLCGVEKMHWEGERGDGWNTKKNKNTHENTVPPKIILFTIKKIT